ncbi:MAG: Zn-dependent exopeptidase M28 [Actinobacteria bacterium]|nr:MAG: Zn-dependent exopeptidase M28 [Actinomycetota bacterium]
MKKKTKTIFIIVILILALIGSVSFTLARHISGIKTSQNRTIAASAQRKSKKSIGINRIKKDIRIFSKNIGVRKAGSRNEHRATEYIKRRLKNIGYRVGKQKFKVGKARSYNVYARKLGRVKTRKIVIGAHYDSKSPSPGANDNASGVATLLELARLYKSKTPKYTILFVFFGAEEKVGKNSNNHHLGSRYFVKRLSSLSRKRTVGMISVDMVGYGRKFHVRSMRRGTMKLVNKLLRFGRRNKYRISFLKDPGRTGWSDHEAFELVGIPAAWIEWRNDPTYHSKRDRYSHLQWSRIRTTTKFLYRFLAN